MAKRVRTRKAVDEIDQVRCKSGSYGVIREEVYVDDTGAVVKYNLVFIHFGLCQQDNGRVLGYDNAHGRGMNVIGWGAWNQRALQITNKPSVVSSTRWKP